MNDPTRILIVEDNPNDFDLAQREIRKSLENCEIKRVETEEEYLAALESLQPDIILSDYGLPDFNGMKAQKLAQEHAVLTPFIIWTGSISEEAAAECMKAGANNYILKENITRLGPAILHALEERQLLLERKEAEDKLRRSESNYRALAEHSLQGIAIFQKHAIVYVNAAMCTIMGYTAEELLKMSEDQILALTHPDDLAAARERAIKRQVGKPVSALNDLRIVRKNGDIRWIQTSSNSIEYDGQPAILSTSIDITERKQAEEKLAERERRFRALI
ncbi:MAG: PAS domain S-box protein [Anaerolineales bacterium]